MKIYGEQDNVFDAADAVVEHGVAVIEGTKTPATNYAKRVIKCLESYDDISAHIGSQNVSINGYFYYVSDLNRWGIGNETLKDIIHQIDQSNS
nr:hypothetical protein [Pseudodesulfovibrio sp.]